METSLEFRSQTEYIKLYWGRWLKKNTTQSEKELALRPHFQTDNELFENLRILLSFLRQIVREFTIDLMALWDKFWLPISL